jgi:hypothetical protein
MSPDDGGAGGAPTPAGGNIWAETPNEPSPATPAPEPAPVSAPEPAGGDGSGVPAPPASAPPASGGDWTPERVAELLRVAREPAPEEPKVPQMSEEEMNKLLNVAHVTQEDVTALLEGGENAVAALSRVVQAAVLQARTTAWYQTQMLLKQQQDSLAPVIKHYNQAEQEKLTNQFYQEYKEFTPDKHMKLLAAVKTSLDAEQAFVGKSRGDGFKLIAERAKELLTASGTPLVPVAQPANGKPGMAQLSRGAGHGAAAADATVGASSTNTAKRFFGP